MLCRVSHRLGLGLVLFVCWTVVEAQGGTVNLQLRPATTSVCAIGGTVDISLYAISADSVSDVVSAIEVILNWNPAHLRLVGVVHTSSYPWLAEFFPDDREIDRLNHDRAGGLFWSEQSCTNNSQCQAPGICNLNVPCADDSGCRAETFCNESLSCGTQHCCNTSYCSYTGTPFNDGNAKANWWAALFDPPGSFVVSGSAGATGTLVGAIRFQVLGGGSSTVSMVMTAGVESTSAVYDGAQPNLNILGSLLTPFPMVTVLNPALPIPSATVVGSKYLRVQPGPTAPQSAIRIKGKVGTPSACVDGYVQMDGSIASTPVYRTGAQWGTQFIKDTELVPGLTYTASSECGTSSSPAPETRLWPFGDVSNDNQCELYDILYILDGYTDVFQFASFYACDIAPCGFVAQAQRIIDITDVIEVLTAYSATPYTQFCPAACTSEP